MRLLHRRHDHGSHRLAENKSESERCTNYRSDERPRLPVLRLRKNSRRRSPRRGIAQGVILMQSNNREDRDDTLSRRDFVQILGAGLLLAATASPALAQIRGREQRSIDLGARLHIGKDGIITVMTGKVECGQGARAEITQAAAEELHDGPDQIQVIMADTALTPDDGITAGS